jgi:hypothetical protein
VSFCRSPRTSGCDAASAVITISGAIAIARGHFPKMIACRYADRPVRIDQDIEGLNGGRDRDRTCDPLHVKEVLSR